MERKRLHGVKRSPLRVAAQLMISQQHELELRKLQKNAGKTIKATQSH